jgi:ribose transport system permease protein
MSSSSAYSEFQSASIYAVLPAALVWYASQACCPIPPSASSCCSRAAVAIVAVGRVRMTAFVASGMMGALAGILYTGTTGSTNPTSGTTLLLPAFAAAFLGATCTKPGRFNAWGSVVAVYFLVPGIKGLSVLGFWTFVHDLFYGGALVIAVMVSQLVSGRKERTL